MEDETILGYWIVALCQCRDNLKDSPALLNSLDAVIASELELASIASKKALSEVCGKNNLKVIK